MSWGHQLFYFIFGMAIIYFTQTRGECSLKHQSSSYDLCGTDQVSDEVNLQCYGENTSGPRITWYCLWTSLNDSSENSYTLVIIQETGIRCHENKPSAMSIDLRSIYKNKNMTAHIFDKTTDDCPKASFRGIPRKLIRCSPPTEVSFLRLSRRLMVNLTWKQVDDKHIQTYALRYKALNSGFWNESKSTERNKGTVENLDPSLSYVVQIGCSPNDKCPKCPWSPLHTLPPELNVQPVILNVEVIDIAGKKGCRLLLISWEFPSRELVEGYKVKVEKASGEGPSDWITTTQTELRLIVSYSAYQLQITAFNNASTSPAVTRTIPPHKHMVSDSRGGKLNVTFHSNTSLTLSWRDSEKIVCYSVELSGRGHKIQYVMFYEQSKTHRWMVLKEPLEPYQMYDIMLHTRTDKNTCNLKSINNSESTYGSLQAYFREGTPVSAPTNISSSNVTLTSMVLTWNPIPVEDLRGHLLGYTLHYEENGQPHTSTPRNTTVDPRVDAQELVDLKSGTVYMVQISAFTSAGEGVKSSASYFETNSPGPSVLHDAVQNSLITCGVLICVILFGSPLLKRAKRSFWPNVPNPCTSNAIQRMVKSYELEPLQLTSPLEEWDTCTLYLPSSDPPLVLRYTGLEGTGQPLDTPAGQAEPSRRDASDQSTGDTLPDDTRTTTSDTLQNKPERTPGKVPSDYTTMDLLHQGVPQLLPACRTTSHAVLQREETNKTVHRNGSDYARQISQSPSNDRLD